MPSSPCDHITYCLRQIINLNPQSVLDVGCGMGRWGVLCREFIDGVAGLVTENEWQARVDGVEIHEPYIGTVHRAVYSNLYIADILDLIPSLDEYDLIIAGDVLEHFPKDQALQLLQDLLNHARQAVMVNIPLGPGWEQGEHYGNIHETHRSQWSTGDFQPWPHHANVSHVGTGVYGTFLFPKKCSTAQRIYMYLAEATEHQHKVNTEEEERCLRTVLQLSPGHQDAATMLTAALITSGRTPEALTMLERAIQDNPDFIQGYLVLGSLLQGTGRQEDAGLYLSTLLERPNIPNEVRQQAQDLMNQS